MDETGDETGVLKLRGAVEHYDWGGLDFIPQLLGISNRERKPFAELWMGAHPKAPAMAEDAGREVPLDRLIAASPERMLGPTASARFGGRLPYLFKVLDVAKMLSIQAHPARAQAKEGFARENAAGINLQAAVRNYKDDNPKPEVDVALTEFWMLYGFRPLEQIAEALAKIPELRSLQPDFSQRLAHVGGDRSGRRALLKELYSTVMTMPQERVDGLLQPLLTRLHAEQPEDKEHPDYWVVRAAKDFPMRAGHCDRGILSIYLLNLVHLRPGQGTFQPAGVLHAYLEGVNVELMANSDNVLRGGLTSKHVDVPELVKILSFESGPAHVLDGEPTGDYARVYPTPAKEFELSRIELAPGKRYSGDAAYGPDSVLVLQGSAILTQAGVRIPLSRGDIIFAPWGTRYTIEASGGPGILFKATVPGP